MRISIFDKVEKIGDALTDLDPDELGKYQSLNFIYPVGQVMTLANDQTVESYNLKSGTQLLLMGTRGWAWSSFNRGR